MWEETFKTHHDSKPHGNNSSILINYRNSLSFKVHHPLVWMSISLILKMSMVFPNMLMHLLFDLHSKKKTQLVFKQTNFFFQ